MKGDEKLSLEETVRRCQEGDTEAFRELFRKMGSKAFGTAYLISGKRGLAEDIVQEAFVCCLEKIKTLKSPEAFNVWFYRMIVRIGWKMVKNQAKLVPDENLPQNFSAQDMEEEIQTKLTNKKLHEAISELPDNLKTVVILFYFNGMTVEEIAKVTRNFKATVKTRLYYARNALRRKLEEDMAVHEESFGGNPSLKKA